MHRNAFLDRREREGSDCILLNSFKALIMCFMRLKRAFFRLFIILMKGEKQKAYMLKGIQGAIK